MCDCLLSKWGTCKDRNVTSIPFLRNRREYTKIVSSRKISMFLLLDMQPVLEALWREDTFRDERLFRWLG